MLLSATSALGESWDLLDRLVQFLGVDWLDEMQAKPRFNTARDIGVHSVPGECNSHHGRSGAQGFHHFAATAVRQTKIADKDVECLPRAQSDGVRFGVRELHFMAPLAQEPRHQRSGGQVVLHQQNAATIRFHQRGRADAGGRSRFFDRGQFELERGALAESGAFRVKRPAVHFHERFGNRQAQPEPAKCLIDPRLGLFEGVKDFRQRLRGDSDAGIGHFDAQFLGIIVIRGPDRDQTFEGSEFHAVADEIPKDLLDPGRISIDVVMDRAQLELDLRLQQRRIGADDLSRFHEEFVRIDDLAMQVDLAIGDAGEIEKIIDQSGLEFHVAADHGNVGANLRR